MYPHAHRFTPEGKAKRHPLAHMPFGWGPRNCIGIRFALLETKLALISVLRKYKFVRAPETEVRIMHIMCGDYSVYIQTTGVLLGRVVIRSYS